MTDDDALRVRIGERLRAGLQTQCTPRAYSSEAIAAVCQRLQSFPQEDLEAKLVTAGFTPKPWVDENDTDGIEQSCATCMYFERHRAYCDLPELDLPVESQWSCILWRI